MLVAKFGVLGCLNIRSNNGIRNGINKQRKSIPSNVLDCISLPAALFPAAGLVKVGCKRTFYCVGTADGQLLVPVEVE